MSASNGKAAPLDHEPELEATHIIMTPRAVHRMHAANRRDRREAIEARERKATKAREQERLAAARQAGEAKAAGDAEAAVALSLCVPGSVWTDARDRGLVVLEVTPGAQDGREVVGNMQNRPGEQAVPFSTTLAMWQRMWHDKAEPCVGAV